MWSFKSKTEHLCPTSLVKAFVSLLIRVHVFICVQTVPTLHQYTTAVKSKTGWLTSTTMKNITLGDLILCAPVSSICKMGMVIVLTQVTRKIKWVPYMWSA